MRTIILIATILILCVFALPSHVSAQVSLLDTSSMNKWAVVFGTKGNQAEPIAGDNNARAMASILKTVYGFPSDHVLLI